MCAHTYLHVPEETPIRLELSYFINCRVWLNGTVIHSDPNQAFPMNTVGVPAKLQKGWNRLLVKVSSNADLALGFRAALMQPDRRPVPNLTVSTAGGAGTLRVVEQNMPDIAGDTLPTAYREWPYLRADAAPYLNRAEIGSWKRLVVGWSPHEMVKAPSLRLQAAGGAPPYRWQLTSGALPKGLSLIEDGRISGTVAADAP
jgi:hypothetical protein